jgi:hypothetical protein
VGYTHYWGIAVESTAWQSAWLSLQLDAAAIVARVNRDATVVVGPDRSGDPVFEDTQIAFNGVGENGHEPLYLLREPPSVAAGWPITAVSEYRERGYWFSFCKTNWKPYDLAVTATLIRATQLAPDAIVVESDGSWNDDWMDARQLIQDLFGQSPATLFTSVDKGPPAARPHRPT